MNQKYFVVISVTVLLISLSVGISVINYQASLKRMQTQLIKRSLPLSIDNIYTEIQKNIIEPNLISSMMATNTFLKDWLINEENNVEKITKYLSTIKNKYSMFNTFLVSEKSGNYYSSKGFLEQVKEDNPNNQWYFKFKDKQSHHEINLDFNEHLDDSMIFFINYKIFDDEFQYLGATGIALKTAYVNKMLNFFRTTYNFKVYFIDKKGKVILSEHGIKTPENISKIPELKNQKNDIFSSLSRSVQYKKDGSHYLLNTKYISELDLILMVEAKIDNFTKEVRTTFYFNLFVSLLITLMVILIILYTIKKYNKELIHLASNDALTHLPNRRKFNENFEKMLNLYERDKRAKGIILFDIDNFKSINDEHGHLVGDKVLKRIAKILQKNTRKTDYISRWGGEEFSVLLVDSNIEQTKEVSEKIRKALEHDLDLSSVVKHNVTASFGITEFKEHDNMSTVMSRADDALYSAKESGKNCIKVKL